MAEHSDRMRRADRNPDVAEVVLANNGGRLPPVKPIEVPDAPTIQPEDTGLDWAEWAALGMVAAMLFAFAMMVLS